MHLDNQDSGFRIGNSVGVPSGWNGSSSASRLLKRLVFIVYFLLIFEGALRKWLLPEYSQFIFFIRDPFVLAIYGLAITNGLWPEREFWLSIAMLLAVLTLLVAVLQLALGVGGALHGILLVLYGMRNYYFYIPLAFIVATAFQREDIDFVKKATYFLVAVSSFLVIVQFYSAPGAVINIGSSEDVALQFHGLDQTGEHTRPMGFFTSAVGQKQLVVSAFAFMLADWTEGGKRRVLSTILLIGGSVGSLVCMAYSGSRTVVLHSGLIILIVLGSVFWVRSVSRYRLVLSMLGVAVMGAFIVFGFLGDGVDTFLERWNAAQSVESQMFTGGIFGRAIYSFVDFVRLMAGTPIVGFGLGMGGNAALTLSANSGASGLGFSAETDWARHIVDLGPILGLLFIAYRVGLTLWLTRRVLKARTVLSFALFGYVFYLILGDQITGHGSVNGFSWIFLGLALAAMKPMTEQVSVEHSLIAGNSFPNLMR